MKIFRTPNPATSSEATALEMLTTLNKLAISVSNGFDERSAAQIAEAAQTILDASAVAVTNATELLAEIAPDDVQWRTAVVEQLQTVAERRRHQRPTVYRLYRGRDDVEVVVAPLMADDVLIGTVHVIVESAGTSRLNELGQFARLVSTQLQLAELEQSRAYAAEAELRALRAQISPHFVHNSLTAIAGLVNTDPAMARDLIATFAEFLRASFRTQTDLTTVADELRLVEAYLELEQARFGSRFNVSLNITPEALPVKVPFLTIQPVVENAIRHGLESRPGAGVLRISAENAGPEVAIHVEDDGVGIDPAQLERALSGADSTSHVGILAVDTRLRSTFGPEYGLTIETGRNAGTKITIRLPKYLAP